MSLQDNRISPAYANDIVHLTSSNLRYEHLVDYQFNLGGPSLKFKRVTEYCQWQQFYDEEDDDDGHTVRAKIDNLDIEFAGMLISRRAPITT